MSDDRGALLLFAAAGVLLAALGWGMRRVPPNRWYGVRTPSTYADERVWRDANRRAGGEFAVFGAALTVVALGLLAVPRNTAGVLNAVVFVGVLGLGLRAVLHARSRRKHYRRLDRGGASGNA